MDDYMKGKITKKVKRRLFFQTVFLFILVFALIFSVFNDWSKKLKNKRKINSLNSEYTSLLEKEEYRHTIEYMLANNCKMEQEIVSLFFCRRYQYV